MGEDKSAMRWTLRKKILTGFGITLSIMVIVTAWALVNLAKLGKASDAILKENYNSILAAENMIESIERQDSAILLIIVGYEDDGIRQFREHESLFLQWLGRAKDNITVEGEKEIVDRLEMGLITESGRHDDKDYSDEKWRPGEGVIFRPRIFIQLFQ